MSPNQIKKKRYEYKLRLKELKRKLKPYRDRDTVKLLRVITGSSAVDLKNYWERLESVLTGEYSYSIVKERIQSVVNDILKNGEYAKSIRPNSKVNMINNKLAHLQHLHISSKSKEFDNVTHQVEINSKPNLANNMTHININSISNVFSNMTLGDINSNSNVSGNVKNGNIDVKTDVINRLRHIHINSCKSGYYEKL